MGDATARITIDADVLTTPIVGSLRGDDGVAHPFVGYMQLITALETSVRAARSAHEQGEAADG